MSCLVRPSMVSTMRFIWRRQPQQIWLRGTRNIGTRQRKPKAADVTKTTTTVPEATSTTNAAESSSSSASADESTQVQGDDGTPPTETEGTATTPAKKRELIGLEHFTVNKGRLMKTLHETCVWGKGKKWGYGANDTGMSRLALSNADKLARDWFVETTKSLGCTVTVDSMGNIFAVRPGRQKGPPTFAGSHLDTQPTGGRYDGILGIMAGVEMLRVLNDHNAETEFPVGVVNWTNEEGARFPISMVSSGVWAQKILQKTAHSLVEVGGGVATMKSELERIGYLGKQRASHKAMPMAAHFELHIEQGPILEQARQKIGVVHGVQAYRWFTITITGRDAHTGTTPLTARSDALLLAARLITHSHRVAVRHDGLASTGILTLKPGSTNTIPGQVTFSLDIRAPADETVEAMEAELKRDFAAIAAGENVDGILDGAATSTTATTTTTPEEADETKESKKTKPLNVPRTSPSPPQPTITWKTDSVSPATRFHVDCTNAIRASAEMVTGDTRLVRDMTSGAGHDSVHTSLRCPTAMIFVPSRGGVSHHPEEFTDPGDCAVGAEVLMQSVLRFDRERAAGVGKKRKGKVLVEEEGREDEGEGREEEGEEGEK